MRPSKMGKWRAAVLISVHVAAAIHIAHWMSTGSTVTPVEPSEAMEFSKHGVINAGLIFFALAILSTLVLGRWFCGWGCHLVALQDLCSWILARLRIRPRPIRSRLLLLVPLLAFLYMFIGPIAYRLLAGESFEVHGLRLTTTEFWATFPSWIPALMTFAICGFVIVYFLGQKGFCTNACPYAGAFVLADQLSPMRIRVTDDCNQCGHCTAACSSNVRVHEEVAAFGAVVDPGCMKCLDCVSVCPNNALYVGFGPPAVATRPLGGGSTPAAVKTKAPARTPAAGRSAGWTPWLISLVFCYAALLLFTGFDRSMSWQRSDFLVSAILTAAALGLVALVRVRSTKAAVFHTRDEILLGVFFLAAMAAFRGIYGLVAFLFALGLSALLAWLSLQLVQLLTRDNLSLHGWRLRLHGRLQPASAVFLVAMAGLLALWAHSGLVQYHTHGLARAAAALSPPFVDWSNPIRAAAQLSDAQRAALIAGLNHAAFLEGWALLSDGLSELRHARLCVLAGRSDEYERRLARLLDRFPRNLDASLELANYQLSQGRIEPAVERFRSILASHPSRADVYAQFALLLAGRGDFDQARRVLDEGLTRVAEPGVLLLNRGLIEAESGNLSKAITWFERAVHESPQLAEARFVLGRACFELGRWPDAIRQLQAAFELGMHTVELHIFLGSAYLQAGRPDLAFEQFDEARREAPDMPIIYRMLADVMEVRGDRPAALRYHEQAARLEAQLRQPATQP